MRFIASLVGPLSLSSAHRRIIFVPGFQLPDDKVSTEDKITFCIIQSYLDFKVQSTLLTIKRFKFQISPVLKFLL